MKKTRIAGIAAVTLLALTPATATTFASSTNDVSTRTSQAVGAASFGENFDKFVNGLSSIWKWFQDRKPDTEKSNEEKATDVVNGIKDVVYDEKNPLVLKQGDLTDYYNNDLTPNQFSQLLIKLKLISSDQAKIIDAGTKLKYNIGGENKNPHDLEAKIGELKNGNGSNVTLTFTTKTTDNPKANVKNVKFTNNAKTIATASNLKINFKTPITVALDSKTLDLRYENSVTSGMTIHDVNGANIAYKDIFVGEFYGTAQNARDFVYPLDLGGKFSQKDATYYQNVTLQFDPNKIDISELAKQANESSNVVFTINNIRVTEDQINRDKYTNSVTFVRQIKVGNNNTTNPNPDPNPNPNPDPDGEKPIGVWKPTAQSGVVTVNNKVAYLVGNDGTYTSRAMALGSKWATDQYRVNSATGAKQYHVSTNEWVSADDVFYQDRLPDFFNNVSQLPNFQTVSLDGPDGFIYALYNTDGVRVDRGLPGNTSWATDRRATDQQGNIYYRVSTNEWVRRSNGVSVY